MKDPTMYAVRDTKYLLKKWKEQIEDEEQKKEEKEKKKINNC